MSTNHSKDFSPVEVVTYCAERGTMRVHVVVRDASIDALLPSMASRSLSLADAERLRDDLTRALEHAKED